MCSLGALVGSSDWYLTGADGILRAVALSYGVRIEQIRSQCRTPRLARARQVVMYLMREKLEWSYPRIGQFLNRDHSTVVHGHRLIEKRISPQEIADIRTRLRIKLAPAPVIAEPAEFYFEATA